VEGTSYKKNVAYVKTADFSPVAAMTSTPVATVKSILGRIGNAYDDGLPKEVYLTALYDSLKEDHEMAVRMIPDYMIHFLMEVWESEEVFVDDERWNFAEYLRILGLLAYRKGNGRSPNEIYVIPEIKDDYYFLLKSRSSRDKMLRYNRWEKIITGLLYYYGLIRLQTLYDLFVRSASQVIPYEEFLSFIKCRCSLWAFGDILQDVKKNEAFFSYCEVDNSETLLMFIREHEDLPYKKVDTEDLIYISDGAGIDNRWPGITEIGTIAINQMKMDYYKATLLIRALIRRIHNGDSFDKIIGTAEGMPGLSGLESGDLLEAVRLLYDHVPVFEYKGHSRKQYQEFYNKKQMKLRAGRFSIIKGGNTSENEK